MKAQGVQGIGRDSSSGLSLPSDVGSIFSSEGPILSARGPRVEHMVAQREDTVTNLVREAFNLPQGFVERLLYFGSIHVSRIVPDVPEGLLNVLDHRVVQNLIINRERARALLQPSLMSQYERQTLQKTRRLTEDETIPQYSYIRIHFQPKRFSVFHSTDWKKRIIAKGTDFVIVNKPPALPCPPTVDNIIENILHGAAIGIETTEPLHITTRIDHATEGLVVLGKTREFVSQFLSSQSRRNDSRKLYRALVAPYKDWRNNVGLITQDALVNFKIPGMPFVTLILPNTQSTGTKQETRKKQPVECQMIIHSASMIEINDNFKRTLCLDDNVAVELEIELITGRTHQIRAQLAALQTPILGDTLYKPLQDIQMREHLLELEKDGATSDAIYRKLGSDRLLYEPQKGIGLQAYKLELADGQLFGNPGITIFEAGKPWWR
eukprot:jgi/Picsp_1/3547/NSC_06385-R1_ribosomal pseudouridine